MARFPAIPPVPLGVEVPARQTLESVAEATNALTGQSGQGLSAVIKQSIQVAHPQLATTSLTAKGEGVHATTSGGSVAVPTLTDYILLVQHVAAQDKSIKSLHYALTKLIDELKG